MKTVLKAP